MTSRRRARSRPLPIIERLKALRVSAGLSQKEVARRIGVDRLWVQDTEGNKSTPRLDLFLAYADALGFGLELKKQQERAVRTQSDPLLDALRRAHSELH